MKLMTMMALGAVVVLAGCAQQEETTMVAPEPVYDKYGNVVATSVVMVDGVAMVDSDGDGTPETPVEPVDPTDPTSPYRNQNQNTNQNRNTNG